MRYTNPMSTRRMYYYVYEREQTVVCLTTLKSAEPCSTLGNGSKKAPRKMLDWRLDEDGIFEICQRSPDAAYVLHTSY